ncbi:hypothetical protein ACTS35_16795 [Citrobacter freundii]|uniref:hypothetical protein n=1 Tax=Citrobacter TaxID=544 RepID=UPI00227A9C99|nr:MULTISPECIES: hypothetical protein [Citrobacter]MDE9714834.1 hypothetical protein [Citrobacter freundii]MDE9724887.1 hypothetical protein [Citrobacter freundii]MDE9735099.1 hypothetical protein [Citrobacter freundii]MEB1022578.1 hypothetical protein [Citrobacter freundii]WIJ20330.1 hypothetical protein QOK75_25180 [Citrobacter freundii]
MKKILTATIVSLGLMGSAAALATSLKGEYHACISEDEFNRMQSIIKHKDQEALAEIFKTSCIMPKKNLSVEKVESMGWTTGVAHVKVYVKGTIYDLWTNTENLQAD